MVNPSSVTAQATAVDTMSPIPAPAIRVRIVGHLEALRSRVAADIVADRSHGRPVDAERVHYLRDLQDALIHLLPQEAAAHRRLWAQESTRAVHDPGERRPSETCRICALLEWVLAHPNDGAPAALSRSAGGPPTPVRDAEAAERLPRLRTGFSRDVASAILHGLPDDESCAGRVLDSLEERLVRFHLDLVLAEIDGWERVERSWAVRPRLVHADCRYC